MAGNKYIKSPPKPSTLSRSVFKPNTLLTVDLSQASLLPAGSQAVLALELAVPWSSSGGNLV